MIRGRDDPCKGCSFSEAVKRRYQQTEEFDDASMCLVNPQTGKSKAVLLVGKEKADAHFRALDRLIALTLDGANICCAGEKVEGLTRVGVLSLQSNGLSDWREVLRILQSLPVVKEIKLTGNHMALEVGSTVPPNEWKVDEVHPKVQVLVLQNCGVSWKEAFLSGLYFPNLRRLSLCSNALTNHDYYSNAGLSSSCGCFCCVNVAFSSSCCVSPSLKCLEELDLSFNEISSWSSVLCVVHGLPHLTSLALRENMLGDMERTETTMVHQLEGKAMENTILYTGHAGNISCAIATASIPALKGKTPLEIRTIFQRITQFGIEFNNIKQWFVHHLSTTTILEQGRIHYLVSIHTTGCDDIL